MITCKHCSSVVGTMEESTELHVIGEIKLLLICPTCKQITEEKLYEYDRNRLQIFTQELVDRGETTELVTREVKLPRVSYQI